MAETAPKTEIWRNVTPGTVFLRKLDHRGDPTKFAQVDSGRQVMLTTEERRINMEDSASAQQCPFRNGTLQAVRVLGDAEEVAELSSNPNAMATSDMVDLLKAHWKTFETKLREVHNTSTLERMLAVAYDQDASIKKVERIKARIVECGGMVSDTVPAPAAAGANDRQVFGRPVSPR